MEFILQIFNGPWNREKAEPDEIIRKIDEISSRVNVTRVIIGYHIDPNAYRKIGEHLHKSGISMLLWLPVFSAVTDIRETDGSLDVFGRRILTTEQQAKDGFVFVCPTSERNLQTIKEIYEDCFSDCGFDGVFLDRIRTQSFAAGVSGVLSCGCSRCREEFLKRGVDISRVARRYEELKDSFFDMDTWPMDGSFRLKDQEGQRFFEAKEEMIAETVYGLCRYYKGKGLTVGLDLIAPLVSRFVGQNYDLITKGADFIKPMLYRRTEAPAGPGYEQRLLRQHVPDAEIPDDVPMDLGFLNSQLQSMKYLSCEVCPGIEVNYQKGVANTDAAYIEESLKAIKDNGFRSVVLCWNMMEAPEANIQAIGSFDQQEEGKI